MASQRSSNGSGWSDGEKHMLLLKIVDQLQKAGGKLNLAVINMPGRTPKAMTHTLSHCRNEVNTMSLATNARGKWTEDERKYLLVKMIDRLQNGGKLDLKEIDMPGRTTKSITHAVQKLKAEAAMLSSESTTLGEGGSTASAATSKKRARKADEENAQDNSSEAATDGKKRKVKPEPTVKQETAVDSEIGQSQQQAATPVDTTPTAEADDR